MSNLFLDFEGYPYSGKGPITRHLEREFGFHVVDGRELHDLNFGELTQDHELLAVKGPTEYKETLGIKKAGGLVVALAANRAGRFMMVMRGVREADANFNPNFSAFEAVERKLHDGLQTDLVMAEADHTIDAARPIAQVIYAIDKLVVSLRAGQQG